MKVIFLILLSFTAYADEIKVCNDFVSNVLKPAVTEVKDAGHGYRFVKEEKTALAFLNGYDASKLAIKTSRQNISKETEISGCKYLLDPDFKLQNCEKALFENLNFMRGLIFGMKNYGWKPSTVELGKKKILDYMNVSLQSGGPFIELAVPWTILDYFVTEFPHKNIDPNSVHKQRMDLEIEFNAYRKEMKLTSKSSCAEIQAQMKEEIKIANKHHKFFADIVNRL